MPVAFLAGLLALFAAGEFGDPIPGHAEAPVLLASAPLLLAPLLFAALARSGILRRYVVGKVPALTPELLLRVSALLSPVVVFAYATHGGYGDLVWQASGDSHLLGALLTGLPLVLAEIPRLVLATQAHAWRQIEASDPGAPGRSPYLPSLGELGPLLRLRLGWVVIVGLPWLLLGAGLDVLALSRPAFAMALTVSAVMTVGFLLLLVVVSAALPAVFRRVLGLRPLPEPVRSTLRPIATAFGFDPDRIYLLPTGGTAVNAMMIGPLPVSRCLCVTDGLLQVLDAEALAGVVAHEVGHARMGHPGLLVLLAVVLPLMLMQPFHMLPIDDLAPALQVALALPVVLLLWLVVRALAHRFELEADVASVRALGAGPCSRALLSVSHATIAVRRSLLGRLSTLHPDESTRLLTMMRYEREPGFRARFDETGRRLRLAIVGAVLVATAGALSAWVVEWRYERAIWRFWSGDVVAAAALRDAIGEGVPARWQKTWQSFGRELAAATEIAPGAEDWATARPAYRRAAGPRGLTELAEEGAGAARPWFALATDAVPSDAPEHLLLCQLYDLCVAIEGGDSARAHAVWAVMRRRPVPEGMAPVVEGRLRELGETG